MIQAIPTKMIDPAGAAATADSAEEINSLAGLEGHLEESDFANELSASLSEHVKVAPVEVSPEQLLKEVQHNLLRPGATESISPKVFDPSMTKGVEKLIAPKNTAVQVPVQMEQLTAEQLLEFADGVEGATAEMKGEMAEAIVKGSIKNTGRSPAIDFAKSEIDPQFMSMEDFVAQKNIANKKTMQMNGYNMKRPPVSQEFLDAQVKVSQTPMTNAGASIQPAQPINSQQFILNMMSEQTTTPKITDSVQVAQKVFDMSDVKTDKPDQIMTQITDYIMQAKASKEPTVQMRMSHDELGVIDITVSKGQGIAQDGVAINIGTHSADGKAFFQQNTKELFTHLNQAGINVSDLKVETPSQMAKNNFDTDHGGRQGQPGDKQFGSEQNQRKHESDRRQDLWKLLNEEAA